MLCVRVSFVPCTHPTCTHRTCFKVFRSDQKISQVGLGGTGTIALHITSTGTGTAGTHVCSFPTRGRRSSRCEKSGRSTRNAIPSSTPGWRHRRPARRRGSGTPRCGGRWASVVEDASQYGMRDKLVEVEVETTEEVIN